MNRPWIWNLVLVIALAVMIVRFPASLSKPQVTLPSGAPPPAREPLTRPLSPPPPEAEALQGIVSRNLFSPSRGKVETSTAPPTSPAPPTVAAPLKVTLFGVVIEEEGARFAYLQDASRGGSGRPKKYREGDSFAGAKVKSIRSDSVILATGSREQTVNLRTPKAGIPSVSPTSLPANPVDPNLSRAPAPARRVPGTPSPRPARRLRRPDTVSGSRGPGPVPTRQRSRPAFLDANSDRSPGERFPRQIDREGEYYQDGYPGPGGDQDYYYGDEEYGAEENDAPW